MKVNQHALDRDSSESLWSRMFAGALVTFVLLVALGGLSEAVLLSFDSRPPQVLIYFLHLTSALALCLGGAASTRLAPRNKTLPLLSGTIVWAVTALILLQLAAGGIEIYGSSTMFGGMVDDGEAVLTDYVASWRSFLGIMVSLLACIVGAWLGSISAVRLRPLKGRQRHEPRARFWRLPFQNEERTQVLH